MIQTHQTVVFDLNLVQWRITKDKMQWIALLKELKTSQKDWFLIKVRLSNRSHKDHHHKQNSTCGKMSKQFTINTKTAVQLKDR